jgi:hypothetical protein
VIQGQYRGDSRLRDDNRAGGVPLRLAGAPQWCLAGVNECWTQKPPCTRIPRLLSITVVQPPFIVFTGLFDKKCNGLKARVVIYPQLTGQSFAVFPAFFFCVDPLQL